jgi:protein-arginine kinase
VRRNIEGVLFGPSITKEQRLELVNNMEAILSKLEGDLSGTFVTLESTPDHPLVKELMKQ